MGIVFNVYGMMMIFFHDEAVIMNNDQQRITASACIWNMTLKNPLRTYALCPLQTFYLLFTFIHCIWMVIKKILWYTYKNSKWVHVDIYIYIYNLMYEW